MQQGQYDANVKLTTAMEVRTQHNYTYFIFR